MELMSTCLDKLLKRTSMPIPEKILGKMAVAVSTLDHEQRRVRLDVGAIYTTARAWPVLRLGASWCIDIC